MRCLVEGQKLFDDSRGMEGSSSHTNQSQMESRYGALGISAGRPRIKGATVPPPIKTWLSKGWRTTIHQACAYT